MKKVLMFLLSLTLILQSAFSCVLFVSAEDNQATVTSVAEDTGIPETIKILAIGNSFSQDAMQWMYDIFTDLGVKEVVLGNMYVGSCSLKMHMDNATSGAESYTYYKGTAETGGEMKAVDGKKSLLYGLQDEQWDYISLQEASGTSGISEAYEPYLTDLIKFVNENKTNPDAKLMWHMTWAYQGTSGHASFPQYGKNQQVMYKSILKATETKVVPHEEISIIIPAGTAIQNVRTSNIGDTVTRDGYHMSNTIGRYTVGAMWAKSILNADISKLKTLPDIEPKITPEEFSIIVESVNNAHEKPFEVTQSKNVTPELYAEIDSKKPYTIVKATEMGKYDAETDTFYFDNGSLVHNNENIVYLPDAAIRMEGSVCCYVDGDLYVPQYILDCMSGKEEYEKFSGEIAKCDLDTKTADGKMKGAIVIKNYLKDDAIEGIVRFKDETVNAVMGDVQIETIAGRETGRTEIELPLELSGAYDIDLSYEFITKYGTYLYDATRYYIFVDKVGEVTVDGKITEGEWDKATKLVLDEESVVDIKDWAGAEDLSAVAYVSYDNDSLYLAAEVTDDVFKPTKHRVWLDGDSIQVDFYVDETGHFDPGAYESVYTEAGISYFENVAGVHRFKSQTGKLGRDMVGDALVAVTQEGNKTTYEVVVKWADLFGEEFTPKADSAVGFAFVVNEKDGNGPEGWLKFASGTGGNDKRNPNKFAQMYFVGSEKEEIVDDGSFVEGGIRYIPFRKVFEALGAEIVWDDAVKTAYATKDGVKVGAAIGAAEITVNGEAKAVSGDVKLIESRTYIPEINTAELFGN